MKKKIINTAIFIAILSINTFGQESYFYEEKVTTTEIKQNVRFSGDKMYVQTCITTTTDCCGEGIVFCVSDSGETECGEETEYPIN